jgi:hypothetical protein
VAVETAETIQTLRNLVDLAVVVVMESVLQLLVGRELVRELLCRVMQVVDSLEVMVRVAVVVAQVRPD